MKSALKKMTYDVFDPKFDPVDFLIKFHGWIRNLEYERNCYSKPNICAYLYWLETGKHFNHDWDIYVYYCQKNNLGGQAQQLMDFFEELQLFVVSIEQPHLEIAYKINWNLINA